jgi:hypothetical protein
MYFDKIVMYILFTIIVFVIVTSLMSFTRVPPYVYNPYLYFLMSILLFDLVLVPQSRI